MTVAEREGTTEIVFVFLVLKMAQAKARIWPCLAYLSQVVMRTPPVRTLELCIEAGPCGAAATRCFENAANLLLYSSHA